MTVTDTSTRGLKYGTRVETVRPISGETKRRINYIIFSKSIAVERYKSADLLLRSDSRLRAGLACSVVKQSRANCNWYLPFPQDSCCSLSSFISSSGGEGGHFGSRDGGGGIGG
jgi:hypothetical protein